MPDSSRTSRKSVQGISVVRVNSRAISRRDRRFFNVSLMRINGELPAPATTSIHIPPRNQAESAARGVTRAKLVDAINDDDRRCLEVDKSAVSFLVTSR